MSVRKRDRATGLIAAAAAASLAGLLAVQFALLRRNLDWERRAFRQDAAGALARVVEKLETRETLKRIWNVSFLKKGRNTVTALAADDAQHALFLLPGTYIPKVQAEGGDVILTLSVPQRVRLAVVEPVGKADTVILDETRPAGRSVIPVVRRAPWASGPGTSNWIKLFLDDVQFDLTLKGSAIAGVLVHPTIDQARAALFDKVLEQYVVFNPIPIEQRVEAAELKEAVAEALVERGISVGCIYGILPAGGREVLLASDESRKGDLLRSEFRTRLFPHDVTVAAADLAFFFPGREGGLRSSLGAPAAAAVLLVLAAAGCLFYILRTAAVQKRYARVLVDFVNNMTHEFKTPISTISLACDALGQDPVRADPGRQSKYRDMIGSECRRMHEQIRKILETAALEKGDLELRFERLDAHEAIRETVAAFSLVAEGRGGAIATRFEAQDAMIETDPVHFRNALLNLLDNAVQYTRKSPEIVVATRASGDRLTIEVADNGIGLSPEDRKKVFDRYYRVPTGNVHDVKGFGLGLSYVKLVARAHGGSVDVRSEEGRGSTFAIEIPFRRKRERGRP